MASKTLSFTKGWTKLSASVIAGSFTPTLKANMLKASRVNGMIVRKAIRKTIKKGVEPANSPLTSAIKGSSKPLVDKGQLFQAITSKVLTPYTVEVGVAKMNPTANIAVALHEGTTITVTARMRGLFALLASASQGSPVSLDGRAAQLFARYKGWKALKASTTHITIPGRPFLRPVLADAILRAKVMKNWQQALAASIEGKNVPKLKT